MSSGFDEYWDREIRGNSIPPEFGGPTKGVTGKNYEQMEFDFGEPELAITQTRDTFTARVSIASHVDKARAIVQVMEEGLGTYAISDLEIVELCLGAINDQLQSALDLLEC